MKDYWDRIIDKELEQRLEAKAKPSLLLRGENPRLKMYPMSLYESRESSGEISLKELFDNPWLDIDGIMRNSTLAEIILRSYARNLSTLAKKGSIYRDVVANMESLSMPTLDSYIAALERLFAGLKGRILCFISEYVRMNRPSRAIWKNASAPGQKEQDARCQSISMTAESSFYLIMRTGRLLTC